MDVIAEEACLPAEWTSAQQLWQGGGCQLTLPLDYHLNTGMPEMVGAILMHDGDTLASLLVDYPHEVSPASAMPAPAQGSAATAEASSHPLYVRASVDNAHFSHQVMATKAITYLHGRIPIHQTAPTTFIPIVLPAAVTNTSAYDDDGTELDDGIIGRRRGAVRSESGSYS